MAVIWKGKGSVTLISVERTKEPNGSESFTWTYCGRESGIDGVFEAFKTDNPGSQVRRWHSDAVHFVSLTQTDTVVDTWTTTLEVIDKDIFSHPNVVAAAGNNPAKFKQDLEDAKRDQTPIDDFSDGSIEQQVYREICRESTNYTDVYLVLKGQRLLPRSAPSRITLEAGPQPVYTTGQLSPAVPEDVIFNLPGTAGNPFPDVVPPNTRWGWLQRGPTVNYAAWKADCNVEFVCAAWSRLQYPRDATEPFQF